MKLNKPRVNVLYLDWLLIEQTETKLEVLGAGWLLAVLIGQFTVNLRGWLRFLKLHQPSTLSCVWSSMDHLE